MQFFFFLFISIIFCFLLAYLPSLTFVLAALWGASLIISALYLTKERLVIILLVNIGALYLLAGIGNLFFYLSFFGLALVVISWLILEDSDYYTMQRWGIITAVFGVSIFLGVIYYSTGSIGISEFDEQLQNYMAENIKYYEEQGFFEFYEERGIMQSDFEENIYSFASKIAQHLPAFYYLQAILTVFFMLLIASWASLKRDIGRLKKRPFIKEIMPWQLAWLAIAGLILWLIGREKMSLIYLTGSNILLVLVPITVYYGLAALIFRIRQRKPRRRKWLIISMVILTIIFPLSIVVFLSIFGLFDSLVDFRKLRIEE